MTATLFLGYQYLTARHQARVNLSYHQAQIQALTVETARLEANQAQIERIEAFLANLAGGPRDKNRFLTILGKVRPPQITVRSILLNENTWSVAGTVHEGSENERGPYADFYQRLFKDATWSPGPDSRSPRPKTPEFVLTGSFP